MGNVPKIFVPVTRHLKRLDAQFKRRNAALWTKVKVVGKEYKRPKRNTRLYQPSLPKSLVYIKILAVGVITLLLAGLLFYAQLGVREYSYTIEAGDRIGAICEDDTRSNSTGRGTCSWHGGVDHWLYSDGETIEYRRNFVPALVMLIAGTGLTTTSLVKDLYARAIFRAVLNQLTYWLLKFLAFWIEIFWLFGHEILKAGWKLVKVIATVIPNLLQKAIKSRDTK